MRSPRHFADFLPLAIFVTGTDGDVDGVEGVVLPSNVEAAVRILCLHEIRRGVGRHRVADGCSLLKRGHGLPESRRRHRHRDDAPDDLSGRSLRRFEPRRCHAVGICTHGQLRDGSVAGGGIAKLSSLRHRPKGHLGSANDFFVHTVHRNGERIGQNLVLFVELIVAVSDDDHRCLPVVRIVRVEPMLEGLQDRPSTAADGAGVGIDHGTGKMPALPPVRDAVAVLVAAGVHLCRIKGK